MLHDVENGPLLYSSPAASPGYTSSNTVPEVPFLCSSRDFGVWWLVLMGEMKSFLPSHQET